MKKIIAILTLIAILTACCAALADSAYTIYYATADLGGITDNNGFVTGCGMNAMNTLVLKDDGTYEYTKLLGSVDENGEIADFETGRFEIRYVFTGSYTREGDQVLLDNPVECVFSEDWGPLVELGYMKNSQGVASEGARVVNYEGTDYDPMTNFSKPVYKFDPEIVPVSITVNADGTFTYNAVASSDDD